MPGVGLDNYVGSDVTIRHKWSMGQRVANGGVLYDIPAEQRNLRDGPRSTRLEATVTDASGLPTSADAGVAARWKVETLGRTQEEYRIGNQSSAVPRNKPKPRMMMCSSVSPGGPGGAGGAGPSVWKNYLTRVQGSAPDPLVRETKDQRRYAPSVAEEVERMHAAGKSVGTRVRAAEPERPWDKNREARTDDEAADMGAGVQQLSDAFSEGLVVPATAVWMFVWVSEWDTQVKIACPWDKKLMVHRCTAELPWVLEQQWHTPEAAQELTKDCIEDFHEMCKTKGYTTYVTCSQGGVGCFAWGSGGRWACWRFAAGLVRDCTHAHTATERTRWSAWWL